ncbi:hypothetical protein VOLCADRAFT_121020 [Volvox carteri f. nagariensis]|uniref:Cytochrome P450 n=1 Tax=Volvox carteri f. nagariensis TaxID=3068 RepID=D8TZI9_VOLCA|nr:uncharacterized protein VOLCADRAFT_121020 [Volvox carteri f. nagariensis]EFJ47190.1 hypothetical protein VOLCADRAFT_121020 [Volvox carteri f. nagariensis]|eukprot:XP_002951739.1 hypothetical protein VOLCADRAFT_121020 [Volvox carteri f. nagariensis]
MPFRKLLQARKLLRDTCLTLIRDWEEKQHKPTKTETKTEAEAEVRNGHAATRETGPTAEEPASTSPSYDNGGEGGGGGDVVRRAPAVAPGSFLGLMLSARDKLTGDALSDDQVVSQAQTFILAGYETTANSLTFAVYNIATHPEGSPTDADLSRMPYTEAVLHETMRLYPAAHAITREVTNTPTQVGGYTIPADTHVILGIYTAHHDERFWPRAEEFIPERFMPDSPLYPEVCPRAPHAHAPFGHGSRMCIGWRFAMQEAKVALAMLYQRLRFELEPGQVPLETVSALTLAPKDGLWVRPVPRVHCTKQDN